MPVPLHDPRWLSLGEGYSDVVAAARFPKHLLRWRNDRAAEEVGLHTLGADEWARRFARFEAFEGNLPAPHALRYHGHQFQHYNPSLGDGRGFLYAQVRDTRGRLMDLGTKGSGTTPWSRGGDGRLTLKGGLREVLATEMLEALGVDTSRSLSLFETGESLERHDEPSPTRAAVLVRLSHGHVRFGTFQRLAYGRDKARAERLLAYTIEHYFPGLELDPKAFLTAVCAAVARTCGAWIGAGFVHGVLNTDNMNVTGESFDYGPWRFAPVFDPAFVAAYFDENGLYAYGRQPDAVWWNLHALQDALRLLGAPLDGALDGFGREWHAGLRAVTLRRLGVSSLGEAADTALTDAVYTYLGATRAPIDRFFHDWWGGPTSRAATGLAAWPDATRVREVVEAYAPRPGVAERVGGLEETPVTALITEVERVWDPIAARDDWAPFERHVRAIRALGARLGD